MKRILDQYDADTPHRVQGIFCGIFIQQNRLQTACEKIQQGMSMKQWLLLALLEQCPEPKTLTNVGRLMGCSRQNVKKLAVALEQKGYLTMTAKGGHTVCLAPTEKVAAYAREMDGRRRETLQLLFSQFREEEIAQLYALHRKLYTGIERVEKYADALEKEKR